jgi:hypothetical protein
LVRLLSQRLYRERCGSSIAEKIMKAIHSATTGRIIEIIGKRNGITWQG